MDERTYKVSNELLGEIRQSPRQATVEEVADLADDLLMARLEIARLLTLIDGAIESGSISPLESADSASGDSR